MKDALRQRILFGLTWQQDLLVVAALLLAGWKYTYGIDQLMDLELADESGYLSRGIALTTNGLPPAEMAPIYAIWYFLLSLLWTDNIDLNFSNIRLLTVILPPVLYIASRRNRIAVPLALAMAFYLLISDANLPNFPKVSHLALVLILLSIIVATLSKEDVSRYGIAGIGALIASYARPEVFVTFILVTIVIIGSVVVRPKQQSSKALVIQLVGYGAIASVLLVTFGLPYGSGNRSWIAFIQHFAKNWAFWTGSGIDPMTDSGVAIHAVFGDVSSISAAFRANPAMFIKHIAFNVAITPYFLAKTFLGHAPLFVPGRFSIVEYLLPVALLTAGVVIFKPNDKEELVSRAKMQEWLLVLVGCYLLTYMLSILMVFPRTHYLLLAGVLAILGLSSVFFLQQEERPKYKYTILILCLGLLLVTPNAYPHIKYSGYRPRLVTVEFLRSLNIGSQVTLYGSEGDYNTYAGNNYDMVDAYMKDEPFISFSEHHGINMILVSEDMRNDSRNRNDPEWLNLLECPECFGYQSMSIPNTNRSLLVKLELVSTKGSP